MAIGCEKRKKRFNLRTPNDSQTLFQYGIPRLKQHLYMSVCVCVFCFCLTLQFVARGEYIYVYVEIGGSRVLNSNHDSLLIITTFLKLIIGL